VPASLIVGTYDLLDYSSLVRLTDTTSFGAGVPDLTTVARVLLDGDVVSGRRTGNRQITLSVLIAGGSIAANATIAAGLGQIVDRQSWAMPWTPADGEPTVAFDCYRGNLTRDWSLPSMPGDPAWLVTLTFAAEPFTRSLNPVVLGASTQVGGVTINGFETTTGTGGGPVRTLVDENGYSVPAAGGIDVPPASLQLDTTTSVVGVKSLRIQQAFGAEPYTSANTYSGVQLATTITLGGVADFSTQQFVVFSAKANLDTSTTSVTYVGENVPADQVDAAGVITNPGTSTGSRPMGRTFYVTLIDTGGKRATWVQQKDLSTAWLRVYVDVSGPAAGMDAGFDKTHVASVRVRYYVSTTSNVTTGVAGNVNTLELLPAPANSNDDGSTVHTPVTVGTGYSALARTTANGPHSSQIGLEWSNASSVVLSTTYGSTAASTAEPSLGSYTGPYDPYAPVTSGTTNTARPTVTGTAPTGAATVRVVTQQVGGPVTGWSPGGTHLAQDATPRRYAYARYFSSTLWLDDLQAIPQGAGMVLSGPYASQVFTGINGVARTPISLAANALGSGAKRFLLARTPNPSPTFNPFLITPATSPFVTTDATAISGSYRTIPVTTIPTSTGLTYVIPAASVTGSYSVLARLQRTSNGTVPVDVPTITAWLTSDINTTSTTSRTLTCTGRDATTLPPGGAWTMVPLGVLTLPPKGVGGVNTAQTITLAVTNTTTITGTQDSVYLDMLVLVDQTGDMIFVDLPAAANWLFVDPPSPSLPYGAVLYGNLPDRTDAVSATAFTYGNPVLNFSPGINQLTTLLDKATTGGSVAVSYYPRWEGEQPHDTTPTVIAPPPGSYPAVYAATY
jgi:hypothetical protein